ncbi:MAG: AraC family transcriptional regulator [Muribaculaceae bacterium]|nr:AraC family transcriptional regulator [Muribaculaceae bacterium]
MNINIDNFRPLLLNIGYARHNSDWNWKNVCSPFTRLYYVTEGVAKIHYLDKDVELYPDHLYIVPANATHSNECKGTFCHYYIHIYEPIGSKSGIFDYYDFPLNGIPANSYELQLFKDLTNLHPGGALLRSDPATYDNSLGFAEYLRKQEELPDFLRMRVQGSILILMSRFIKEAIPKKWTSDSRLIRAIHFIEQKIASSIGLKEVADAACVSKQHVIRIFKYNLGQTPLQFITNAKMRNAELQLLTTDKPVNIIALELGYSDTSYFIRMFRRHTGKTPNSYRLYPTGISNIN